MLPLLSHLVAKMYSVILFTSLLYAIYNLDWDSTVGSELNLSLTSLGFYYQQNKSIENTVGKGEIIRNEQFLFFPQCFPPIWRTFCHYHQI